MTNLFEHTPRRDLRNALVAGFLGLALGAPVLAAGTLDKVRDTGKLTLGYSSDARPYAYSTEGGKPAGYAIELCAKVADALKSELKLATLAVDYVAVTPQDAFTAVQQGKVDLLCGATETLERRAQVDFTIPIMLSGTGVALRADAPVRLLQAVSGQAPSGPAWRGSPDVAPQRAVAAVIGGIPLEKVVASTLKERHLAVDVVPVKDTAAGLELLAMRKADAFFNDRAMLLDAVKQRAGTDVVVAGRLFRRDIVAMAVRRDDGDFHLFVDRTLSRLYRSAELNGIYTRNFGTPTPEALDFFKIVAIPD